MFGMPLFIKSRPDVEQSDLMAKETNSKPNRSLSGLEVKPVYTPEDLANTDFVRDLGQPGEFPFTRGPYPNMYLGRLWTRRQIAGFGTAQATNERYRFLLDHGQNGISTDFDHPTLTGYDSDHDLAEGEVGRLGVAIDSVRDMDDLFLDIPLDKVSVSLTINHPAIVLMGMFLSVSEKRGVDWKALRGTVQNDSLKEFHGQKTFALGPGPSLKLTTDIVEFCTKQVPNWYTISISGYHIRESGSDAIQELAFTIAQGMAYVESALERGLPVDSFAPRLSFFFGCHNDVFEEVAKFRAARRMWARIMKERYNAQKPESMRLRFHTQTLGSTLMRQDPQNNIARGTLQALAAVLGGTQSLHVSGFDEAFDIPSEEAMRMSLATQLILSHESGVTNTVDPMAGSYFMESMTNDIEEAAWEYISKIEALGEGLYQMKSGMLHAIDTGYIELEIARSAYEYQLKIESGEQVVVGLNQYQSESNQKLELFQFDPEEEEWQKGRLAEIRGGRSPADVKSALASLKQDAQNDKNLMPAVLAAVGAMATEGEILDTMRDIYGEYVDPGVF
jgi:methylmalonyl-CoA mutase N-terminal domain/subunit